ncbi:MAG: 30S ribosomal protein S4 [Parcubacteria group bacterium CG11_big_fil_rev_8_21_14_0_20_39_14]|nr:MAG: 30S ribosomal protein S4 [Parcubacteria group bacterium CG11_big_fil_rev_8_21_14_0_20_39_14]PIS35037.1 MAG: 30S ribosomal protein S4 [Parcubacteria group bacterium CG08_land_8_20_14_0_20_38_56]
MINSKCKICQRAGQKLFLKGERCLGQKCSMIRRPYPSGTKKKRRKSQVSEYGKQLQEKQRVKFSYGIREKQFKKYVKDSLKKISKEGKGFVDFLIEKLESRLDSVVFRAGLVNSRSKARFLVSHGHFLVNKKRVNFPSFQLKTGDVVSISEKSKNKTPFKDLSTILKKYQPSPWLELDPKNFEVKIIGTPSKEEVSLPGDLQKVGEFYSR